MGTSYYKTDDGYIAVTSQSPKGFRGSLYIGRGGPIDAIVETCFSPQQLRRLAAVDLADVPAEWVEALGYDEPVEPEDDELVMLDEEGENLVALIPIRRAISRVVTPEPETGSDRFWYDLGLIIGMLLFLSLMFS